MDLEFAPNVFLDGLLYTPDPPNIPHQDLFLPGDVPSTDKFARQYVNVEQRGQIQWSFYEDTTITFQIPPGHADILEHLWISFTLPDIYSPVAFPSVVNNYQWSPYEFQWVEFLGTAVLRHVDMTIGGQFAGGFPDGTYLYLKLLGQCTSDDQRAALHESIGHVAELHDPANAAGRQGLYPNVMPIQTPEPSIRARRITVPIPLIFKGGYPLCRTPTAEILVHVTFRPLCHWFRVRDVEDAVHGFPYVAPDFNQDRFRIFRFLQPPRDWSLSAASYGAVELYQLNTWTSNLHLLTEQVTVSDDKREQLTGPNAPLYVFLQCERTIRENVVGPTRIDIPTKNVYIHNLVVLAQRSDVATRNEWMNFTNWAYRGQCPAPLFSTQALQVTAANGQTVSPHIHPNTGMLTGIYYTGSRDDFVMNERIIQQLGLAVAGQNRELLRPVDEWDAGVRLYRMSGGSWFPGVHVYTYGTSVSDPATGASPWAITNLAQVLVETMEPPVDTNILPQLVVIGCDANQKPLYDVSQKSIYLYTFTVVVYVERVNTFVFGPDTLLGGVMLA